MCVWQPCPGCECVPGLRAARVPSAAAPSGAPTVQGQPSPKACTLLDSRGPGRPVQSHCPQFPADPAVQSWADGFSIRRIWGWGHPSRKGLLVPDLCPSRNREASAHQTPPVRPGRQPRLPQPCVPRQEGNYTCGCEGLPATKLSLGAAKPSLYPPGSQPSLTCGSPGPHSLLRAGPPLPSPSVPLTSPPEGPQPPTRDCSQLPALRGAGAGTSPRPIYTMGGAVAVSAPPATPHPQPAPAWRRAISQAPAGILCSAIKVLSSVSVLCAVAAPPAPTHTC